MTALDVPVRYAEGVVSGLIEADLCAGAGDSGGPLPGWTGVTFDDVAMGLVSGGSTNVACGDSAFRSYYQPVDEVFQWLGSRPCEGGAGGFAWPGRAT